MLPVQPEEEERADDEREHEEPAVDPRQRGQPDRGDGEPEGTHPGCQQHPHGVQDDQRPDRLDEGHRRVRVDRRGGDQQQRHREGVHRLDAALNGGGASIRLHNVNGGIAIHTSWNQRSMRPLS